MIQVKCFCDHRGIKGEIEDRINEFLEELYEDNGEKGVKIQDIKTSVGTDEGTYFQIVMIIYSIEEQNEL